MNRLSSTAAALRRLTEIEAEIARIVAVFPELRRSTGMPARLRLIPPRLRRTRALREPDPHHHV